MQEVFRAIGRLAHSHATVLITVNQQRQELVAQALHATARAPAGRSFAEYSRHPQDLLESELFGTNVARSRARAAQRRGPL